MKLKSRKSEFINWLVEQTPRFDEMMVDDYSPLGGWMNAPDSQDFFGRRPEWLETLDFVRRMSEGKSWTPTRWNPDEEEPEDYVRLKVRSIWPDLRPKWTETKRNPLLDSLPLVHP